MLVDAVYDFIAKEVSLDDYPDVSSFGELFETATFIISHPNNFEKAQKGLYMRAALSAELVPDTAEGKSRIVFVSEGDASLHFLLSEDSIERLSVRSCLIGL